MITRKRLCLKPEERRLRIFDIRRIAIELVASVGVSWLMVTLLSNAGSNAELSFRGVSFTAIMLVGLSEGIFIFDSLVSKKYPWHQAITKRVIALFVFAPLWLFIVGISIQKISQLFFDTVQPVEKHVIYISLTFFILFSIIYVISLIGYNFHNSLKSFILENERLKRDKLEMDYFALQDQLNPHFLFNNLSTLMALIRQDTDKAEKFTADFTDVYRYVLMSSRYKVAELEQELKFIKSYVNIHLSRLGNGLKVDIDITGEITNKKIPPLSLQHLVENAIKHNVATEQKPLSIFIGTENGKLVVKNNLQLKTSTYSTNTGLGNLARRYKYFTTKDEVEVEVLENKFFVVRIPLL